MIDLTKYRVIDLSPEIIPGERKTDGRYLHGEPYLGRPVEVEEFIAYGARMHFIHGQTHTGTHVEAPYKYSETGPDVGSMLVDSYMGEAVACDFSAKKASEPSTSHDLRRAGVKGGDIVLAWGDPANLPNRPHFAVEAIDWLIGIKIKALAQENLRLSPPDTPYGPGDADCKLLMAGIPIDARTSRLPFRLRPTNRAAEPFRRSFLCHFSSPISTLTTIIARGTSCSGKSCRRR